MNQYQVEMRFDELDVGDFFEWGGVEMQKIGAHKRPRYGNVNCRLVEKRFYPGDTGHRVRYHTDIVRKRLDE